MENFQGQLTSSCRHLILCSTFIWLTHQSPLILVLGTKIYTMSADSLLHQYKCQTRIKIISFIEDKEVVEKIFKHLGLWFKKQPSPKANAPPKSVDPTWIIRTLSYPHSTIICMLMSRIQKTFQPDFLKWELGFGAEVCGNQSTYSLFDQ